MPKLVLIRHGQSVWNLENRFTGWTDVDLSADGIEEARRAGRILADNGNTFDVAYTSVLKRAIRTLGLVLSEMDLMWIPVHKTWMLNERHYGALQGLNKDETAKEYGDEQVHIWRRSVDVRPPAMDKSDERYAGRESKYATLREDQIPLTENLSDTEQRVSQYWRETIEPAIRKGQKVLISAHGNTIRALVKYLDKVSDDKISELNLPTGVPLVYELDKNDLSPLRRYYLDFGGQQEEFIIE